jgi:alanyl-tRNA synthetase
LGLEHCDKKDKEHDCSVNGECGRYIELWNLVFIQYNRDQTGSLTALPAKHVDTGAGFERLVAVLQNKRSNYDTDVFMPLLEAISELVGMSYHESPDQNAYRVIADHIRMLAFSIGDGAFPSNEGRGYVVRRILRRAARYGRILNMHEPFIYKLVIKVSDILGETFPEIVERSDYIAKVIYSEEEHFNRTLDRGLEIFDKIKTELQIKKKKIISGSDAFKLYDTYGFPLDLTQILADESGLQIDMKTFNNEMKNQRARARKAAKFQTAEIKPESWVILTDNGVTNFVGYSEEAIETHIVKYSIQEDKINIVLKDTPFYAESGGQIGDQGIIVLDGFELNVLDTQKDGDEIIHICALPDELKITSDRVFAEVSINRRRQTEKNHTATHLLHAALRNVLGDHVQQAGSLVEPNRLRFDFRHHSKVTEEELTNIERIVNDKIQEDVTLAIARDTFENAKKRGAMALFGEKYEDVVRTIQINNFSLELCGGTHVRNTGQIGPFVIIYEGSISSGIRRIEALTGRSAVKYLQYARDTIHGIGEMLNSKDDEILQKTQELLDSKKQIEKELEKLNSQMLTAGIENLLKKAQTINGVDLIIQAVPKSNVAQLKEIGDKIRELTQNTVALLGTNNQGKLNFVCIVTDDLIKNKNLDAGKLVQQVAQVAGGSGGGRAHMATAGGRLVEKFDQAMEKIKELV